MCGIAGFVAGSAQVDREAVGRRMLRALAHRGPDGHGVAALPNDAGLFAHTRLKVIDLSERAKQPFVSEDGMVVLTFNGEIYNYRTLRALLISRGVSFRSDSDTEVVLEQYRMFGDAGLDALDGMFALAIWDARRSRLVLARDRFGKKPLFYSMTPDGGLVFGSEIKALWCHPQVPKALDPAHLPEFLTYGYVSTPNCLVRSVRKLPPATRLVFERGHAPHIETYWELQAAPNPHQTKEEAIGRIRDVIGRAVRRRLESDVPLGAFLSGGIDSSIVVAEMARHSAGRIRTFAVGFEGDPTFDERLYARQVAALFDTQHTEIVVDVSPHDLMEKLLYHHDEPYGDSSALAVFAVSQATKQHVTVVLTGDGGDEMFGGYTRFLGGLLTSMIPSPLSKALHLALRNVPEPRGYKNPVSLLRRFTEHGKQTQDEQLLAWNTFFAGPSLRRILRRDLYDDSFDPWGVMGAQAEILREERSRGANRLEQILRHNLKTYLLDDLLVKTDRMSMAVGLEARSPFLDPEVAELAFSIPSSMKIRGNQLKWILREAYREELPPCVLDRKKHGFGVPLASWWTGELRPLISDLLLAPSARLTHYLDPQAVADVVDEHIRGVRDHAQRIFALVQLELWLRNASAQEPVESAA